MSRAPRRRKRSTIYRQTTPSYIYALIGIGALAFILALIFQFGGPTDRSALAQQQEQQLEARLEELEARRRREGARRRAEAQVQIEEAQRQLRQAELSGEASRIAAAKAEERRRKEEAEQLERRLEEDAARLRMEARQEKARERAQREAATRRQPTYAELETARAELEEEFTQLVEKEARRQLRNDRLYLHFASIGNTAACQDMLNARRKRVRRVLVVLRRLQALAGQMCKQENGRAADYRLAADRAFRRNEALFVAVAAAGSDELDDSTLIVALRRELAEVVNARQVEDDLR